MFSKMSENTNKKINFDIISSGSSGNCVILNESIALDMGVPFKKIEPYLNKIKLIFISSRPLENVYFN